jgi:hypothetical protein
MRETGNTGTRRVFAAGRVSPRKLVNGDADPTLLTIGRSRV